MGTSSKIEFLRRNDYDVLDRSGPKAIRHPSLLDSLQPKELNPYIPAVDSKSLVYEGVRKCCEINDKGIVKVVGSSTISLLRPFADGELGHSEPRSDFNILLRRMKNQGVNWDSSFNVRGVITHFQDWSWLFWLNDILESFSPILKALDIYSAIYVSQYSYARNINIFKAFLERWSSDTNTFHAIYGEIGISLWDIHRISGLPIIGEFYDEYTPSNDILYSDAIPACSRDLFNIYANNPSTKQLNLWTDNFIESSSDSLIYKVVRTSSGQPKKIVISPSSSEGIELRKNSMTKLGFRRKSGLSDSTYLAGFLAIWLSGFVFTEKSSVRPSTFVAAGRMAGGTKFSLAVPLLAHLYDCLGKVALSSAPGKDSIQGPFHYLFGWISLYFPKTYVREDPRTLFPCFDGTFLPYLGRIGNQVPTVFLPTKAPFAESNFCFMNQFRFKALYEDDEPSEQRIEDCNGEGKLSSFLLSYLISLRSGVLVYRAGSSLITEPYSPNRYARQFGFGQARPPPLDISHRTLSFPNTYFHWRAMTRHGTNVDFVLPSRKALTYVTEPYGNWWTESSYPILQFIPDLPTNKKRKVAEPTQEKERKKKKSKPKSITKVKTSIGPPLLTRKNSPPLVKTYSYNDLLNTLEDLCSSSGFISLQFERVNPDIDVPPIDNFFPEVIHRSNCVGTPSNPKITVFSPMDRFRGHLTSLLVGRSKKEIVKMFSGEGFELPGLGRVRVKDTDSSDSHRTVTIPSEHLDHDGDDFTDESDYTPLKDDSPNGVPKSPLGGCLSHSSPQKAVFFEQASSSILAVVPSTSADALPIMTTNRLVILFKVQMKVRLPLSFIYSGSSSSTSESKASQTPSNFTIKSTEPSKIASSDKEWLDEILCKLVKPSSVSNSANNPALHHFNQAAQHVQRGLVASFGSMDFSEYEGMILQANEAFTITNSLSTDYLSFYDNVKEFIKCSALLTRMGSDDFSREELQSQYEETKVHFDEVFQLHTEISASLSKSQEHVSTLEEKIISTKNCLKELEADLLLRKAEVSSFSSQSAKTSQDLSSLEENLAIRLEALESSKKINASREAAKQAFDNAKATLDGF